MSTVHSLALSHCRPSQFFLLLLKQTIQDKDVDRMHPSLHSHPFAVRSSPGCSRIVS